jgi:hypothetical protein
MNSKLKLALSIAVAAIVVVVAGVFVHPFVGLVAMIPGVVSVLVLNRDTLGLDQPLGE